MQKKDYNTITVFKYFISFLEVWKEENYGNSAEINWQAVWSFVNTSGVLDFNEELQDLVIYSSPEECEEKVHQWIMNRIFNNEPIYLLFNMSDWLFQKLEQEHNSNINKAEQKRFEECKCYHCKYWKDSATILYEGLWGLEQKFVEDCTEEELLTHQIHHLQSCKKREELKEAMTNGELKYNNMVEFSYKPFNGDRCHNFRPQPMELKDCPFFEENGISYNEYISKYKELA